MPPVGVGQRMMGIGPERHIPSVEVTKRGGCIGLCLGHFIPETGDGAADNGQLRPESLRGADLGGGQPRIELV